RAFVLDPAYPCVGAKSAVNQASYRVGVYAPVGSAEATAALARDLRAFVEEPGAVSATFATFVAVFEGPTDTDPEAFEALLWLQLQRLHERDAQAWAPDVSSDPEHPHFGFSFAETPFFVVGLHPGSSRLSRRFPWPALVFNPHAQFEALRADGKWERMKEVIRAKDTELQGDINPVLRDYGTESEARQYSGRIPEDDWVPPFRPRSAGGQVSGDEEDRGEQGNTPREDEDR
nr:YqcI/YcgG family protein [Deltaproteobacteria bacterium]